MGFVDFSKFSIALPEKQFGGHYNAGKSQSRSLTYLSQLTITLAVECITKVDYLKLLAVSSGV
jgi:hypothetical protein